MPKCGAVAHRVPDNGVTDVNPSTAAGTVFLLTIDEVHRAHVLATLRRNHGHVLNSALQLGITRDGLYQKIRRLHLAQEAWMLREAVRARRPSYD